MFNASGALQNVRLTKTVNLLSLSLVLVR